MKPAAFVLVAVLAAGCGGGGSGGGGSAAPTVAGLADKLGCTSLDETTTDRELFTAGQADCAGFGDTLHLRTFDSNTARDNWIKTAKTFGGRFDVLDRAVVYGEQSGSADQAKAKVGGSIRT